jgi:hypothetical protein
MRRVNHTGGIREPVLAATVEIGRLVVALHLLERPADLLAEGSGSLQRQIRKSAFVLQSSSSAISGHEEIAMQHKRLQFGHGFRVVLGDEHNQAAQMTLAPGEAVVGVLSGGNLDLRELGHILGQGERGGICPP